MNNKLMQILFLSCEKATELIEMKQVKKIGYFKEVQLKFHLAVCSACKLYSIQSKLINKILFKKINQINQDSSFENKAKDFSNILINKIANHKEEKK